MPKTTRHIKNTKHILTLCFALFALSSCIVKETVLGAVNLNYAKPLNKSKTTTQVNSCEYSQNEHQHISTVKKVKISKKTQPVCFSDNLYFLKRPDKAYHKYSKNTSGSSPPKYILYKRLKLDVA